MYQLQQTGTFASWLKRLRDAKGKARILARLESAKLGNLGDCKAVGDKVQEMRVHFGPGYRLYFTRHKDLILVLLCGGDKSSQTKDIRRAKEMVRELEE